MPAALTVAWRSAAGRPVRSLRSSLADRPEEAVGGLACPLLVLRGRLDPLCPAPWARALADRAPAGRVQVVPGAHDAPYTQPGPTAAALRSAAEQAASRR